MGCDAGLAGAAKWDGKRARGANFPVGELSGWENVPRIIVPVNVRKNAGIPIHDCVYV